MRRRKKKVSFSQHIIAEELKTWRNTKAFEGADGICEGMNDGGEIESHKDVKM